MNRRTYPSGLLLTSVAMLSAVAGSATRPPAAPDAYLEGLRLWRKPGKTADRAACANCHAPDGLDIASYAFSRPNIMRRARRHLPPDEAARLADFIEAIRAKYGITDPDDPYRYRPLQPMRDVLPGGSAAERDLAFANELRPQLPTLFGPRISSWSQAERAENELTALNPWTIRSGVPLSQISEDFIHGDRHATIAQWFPETGSVIPTSERDGFYRLEDAYLRQPTQTNLRRLLLTHAALTRRPKTAMVAMGAAKFRATLMLDYRLRNHVQSGAVADEIVPGVSANPVWEVGEVARDFIAANPDQLGMTAKIRREKLSGPPIDRQLKNLRVAWFWLGWLLDQGGHRTSTEIEVKRGDWLAESLWVDGPYPVHAVYATARRQIVLNNVPNAYVGPEAGRRLMWDLAALRIDDRLWRMTPHTTAHRTAYLTFTANVVRLNLWRLQHQVETTHQVWIKTSTRKNAQNLFEFLEKVSTEDRAVLAAWKTQLLNLIDSAEDARLSAS